VPGGTFIGLNAWGVQLNSVYGWDPEIFRPERWLVEDKDLLLRMQKVHELIFGYGNTKCLGIPIAMMNLNKIFVEVSIPITISSQLKKYAADGEYVLAFPPL
jgi:cytochrome P450